MRHLSNKQMFNMRPVALAVATLLGPAGAALALLGAVPQALGAPQGGQVVAGQASVSRDGATTTVQQQSSRAAIDWQSFSVGAAETVRFQQPSSSAVVLNRVVGAEPSAIFGRIAANGQVLLVNPNGILFGRGAQVDVGGLVASTSNITNADFMSGRMVFNQPGKPGARVENQGTITVGEGGFAALVGRGVSNSGVINARLGKVTLAAGDAFVLDLYGDRLVNLIVDPEAMTQLSDVGGAPLAAYVDHSGQITAEGGRVQILAATAKRLVDNLINVSGSVRATAFATSPGKISLIGDDHTRLAVSGSLDAAGEPGAAGGRIEATGRDVRLAAPARLDASGDAAGGSISVGGDWQGKGSLPNADHVDVASGTVLDASARSSGAGGTVVVWSDGATRFQGQVVARGQQAGGRVEVSGRRQLGFDGDVDVRATAGQAGSLLLDPANIVIAGNTGSLDLPGADAGGDFTVKATAINRQLSNGTSVTLQAGNDITVGADAIVDGRAPGGGTPGGGLTLEAGRDVAVDGLVILNQGPFKASAGGVFRQGASSAIATLGGPINVDAGAGLTATNLITTGTVALNSLGGAVSVSEAIAGGAQARVASLQASGRNGVALARGALVAGTTRLDSQAGGIAVGATLDSQGAVTMQGATGVATAAIVTPSDVAVNSSGAVRLGAVAAGEGVVDAGMAKASSLTVRTPGTVALAGAALGTGGLLVEGTAAGSQAAGVDFGDASLFSAGAVTVRGDSIVLGQGGVLAQGAIVVDAGRRFASGEGKLESAGSALVTTRGDVELGLGGLQAGAAQNVSLVAGGALTAFGAISAGGQALLESIADRVTLSRAVDATGITVRAGTTFTQQAESELAARQGHIDITSSGDLTARSLITTGAVALNSPGGAVSVSEAVAGGAQTRAASLQASGRNGVTLAGGALVAGTTRLDSQAGGIAVGATLDSQGAVTMQGATGVATAAIVTPSDVAVSSNGPVRLGTVAGVTGTVGTDTAAARSLAVRTPAAVTLGGAALGAGGLRVEGPAAGMRSGALRLEQAGVFSIGMVAVQAESADLGPGLRTGNALVLDVAGDLNSGQGKLEAAGPVQLNAGAKLTIGPGGLEVTSAQNITVSAERDIDSQGPLRTYGGTIALTSRTGSIGLQGAATWSKDHATDASGRLQLNAPAGDVVLKLALGGSSTGYGARTGDGTVSDPSTHYIAANRPEVGAVSIAAGGNVELNGLNLDGSADGQGLAVTAGHRLISNALIAVTKGDITLVSKGTEPFDGIYLGNSVYSRGWTTSQGKTGYSIDLSGSGLYLFNNTNDFAQLPDSNAGIGLVNVPKITVANNVANYTLADGGNDPLLVNITSTPASGGVPGAAAQEPMVKLAASSLKFLAFKGPLSIQQNPASQSPGSTDLTLKVQVFPQDGMDKATAVVATSFGFFDPENPPLTYGDASPGAEVSGIYYQIDDADPSRAPTRNFIGGDTLITGAVSGSVGYTVKETGAISGFANNLPVVKQGLDVYIKEDRPLYNNDLERYERTFNGTVTYGLSGRLVQTDAASTRMLIGPGNKFLQTSEATSIFDNSGFLSSITGSNVTNPRMESGNSTVGVRLFTELGSFGSVNNGTTSPVSGRNAGDASFGGRPTGLAAEGRGNAFTLPLPEPLPEPRLGISQQPVEGTLSAWLQAGTEADSYLDGRGSEEDVVLGSRPGAYADFGRTGPYAGSVLNVFGKRYPLARVADPALCNQEAFQCVVPLRDR